jgi:predicted permease
MFTAALALGTGLVFGLFPALEASRPDLIAGLRGQAGQPGGSRAAARFRRTLATAQVALSLALLVSAGLFTRSLANASRVDLGLRVDNLLTFGVSPELSGYSPEQSKALFERIEDEAAAIPGVTSVAASMVPLISGSNWGSSVSVEGFEAGPDTDRHAQWNRVGPGFFDTVGVPLLAGREFTRQDVLGGPRVAIVNEAFARKFGLGRNPIGKRMGTGMGEELDIEIVGLVQDAKYSDVKQVPPPQFALPWRQDEQIGALNFYVRGALAPDALVGAVPPVLKRLDPSLPIEELRTMPAQIHERLFLDRFISVLAAAFAVLATLLAALGLYGVLAYTVSQRTREFGLRMALGADAAGLRALVLGQVGWMTLIGAAIGLPAAIGLGRLARSLLFEVESHDPVVLAVAVAALAVVALAAGALPARRASQVDPMRALRYE